MKRITIPALLAIVLLLCQSLSFAAVNQFTGTWKNTDPNTGGVTKLTISGNANSLKMRAWGKCHPQDCDWGEVSAIAYASSASSNLEQNANAVSAIFTTSFSQTLVIVRPNGSNRLRADIYTRFTDGSGRSNYMASHTFNRQLIVGPIGPIGPIAPLPAIQEDCISFNPATATVRNIDGRWTIVDGNHLMFNFGSNRPEAIKALQVIKRYRMNSSCFVGRPDPSFQYLLVNGRAPQGAMPGEDCVAFNPNTIEVRNIGGRWKIVDGSHWVFDFEGKEDEARKAFAIIRKYGFTRSCFVGRPDPSFQYLRK
ncbi:MAG: hypothetical protein K9I59_09675 [Chlorobium sp.]|uniref:hypothetical protein n=1 Tax=Chlorobium sp. TaxID=1095 RepID=UPI0025BFCD73|nr:hypothetical protein [Chlorobium sp.]MCF8217088.1 hypothetical protein [Chlorobium sp.]MCF8271934.1 hypothetical protein [Chlorobium sp.]MCF8288305.1 hypothetical protein [Chlorobium sp.]MCF8291897.1 hypothetical protein [Chlorobium sp.]MCF8386004.1 hypothetical protein [Chlorobium sp.]